MKYYPAQFLLPETMAAIEEQMNLIQKCNDPDPELKEQAAALLDYLKGQDPDFPLSDWQHEVGNKTTRMGYWEWVSDKHEEVELGGE